MAIELTDIEKLMDEAEGPLLKAEQLLVQRLGIKNSFDISKELYARDWKACRLLTNLRSASLHVTDRYGS